MCHVHTQKKIYTASKLTKVTFSNDKISMSMSSTDKYIPGMFCRLTYVDVRIRRTRSLCILNVFFILEIPFLAKYCADSTYLIYLARTNTQVRGEDLLCAQQTLQSVTQTQVEGIFLDGRKWI